MKIFICELILLAVSVLILSLNTVFKRVKNISAVLVFAGLAASFYFGLNNLGAGIFQNGFVFIAEHTPALKLILIILGFSAAVLAVNSKRENYSGKPEYLALMALNLAAGMFLMSVKDSVMFILSLEVFSFSGIFMLLSSNGGINNLKNSAKTFIFSFAATGMIIFGLSLLFLYNGSMDLDAFVSSAYAGEKAVVLAVIIVFTGLIMKLGVAPLHFAFSDSFSTSSISSVVYIASAYYAVFAVLYKNVILDFFAPFRGIIVFYSSVLWVVMMIISAAGMYQQSGLKGFLFFASAVQFGFVFFGAVWGFDAAVYYLLCVVLMNAGFGGIITVLNNSSSEQSLSTLSGLFGRSFFLTLMAAGFLLSYAGAPLFAGFVGKFLIICNIFSAGRFAVFAYVLIIWVVSALICLKLLKAALVNIPLKKFKVDINPYTAGLAVICLAALLLAGLFPEKTAGLFMLSLK